MNEKAMEIGAINTHFTSPHGLDDVEHYSTAKDLAIIADYALNIEYISNIVKLKKAEIKINNYNRIIGNTNEMLSCYSGADGVKTGYTGDAGRCLVTSATVDDWQLISVVLGCNTKKQRTIESTQLLNYGFQNFEFVNLCENMQKEFEISVDKSKDKSLLFSVDEKFLYPLTTEEMSKIEYSYNFKNNFEAPVEKNTELGKIEIKLEGKIIKQIKISLKNKICRKNVIDYLKELLIELGETMQSM